MSDLINNGRTEAEEAYTLEGTVASPDRAGVGGLRVEIVDKNVGQDVSLADATTDEGGRYNARFSAATLRERGKARPDLQARVWASGAADAVFLAASDVRYNATNNETLDVELPTNLRALPSEYETLTGVLAKQYDGRLGDLEESDDRQDITYLGYKTGYDLRMVAMAALADQFGGHRGEGMVREEEIEPAFYYALFRAGLPADPETLYQASADTVGGIWRQAIERGVIPKALEDEIPRAMQAFQDMSAARALDARALAGASTLGEMLDLTLGDDPERQQRFADLYTRERGDLPAFWSSVRESFGEETEKRLRLDGQLGYLTLNNAPLIGSLHEAEGENPLSDTVDLARRGYFRAEKWGELINGSVPEQVPGDTPEDKRANYAELLAAQVRLSFPTPVVAEMVRSGELPLTDDAEVRDAVHAFLTENRGEFEIGMHPVEQYVARNDLQDRVSEPVKEQIKRIQRVYQITPTDEAMKGLLENDLDSAYKVAGYDEAAFVRGFGENLGGEDNARLTHARAQQVHNATLNIATGYLTSRIAPALGSDASAMILDPSPNGQTPQATGPEAASASDVIAYPTLEGLFGSMDYCACEECRSILSPAAYLVDLLHFIDRPVQSPPDNWIATIEGQAPVENPQTVLLQRRPDIENLQLTCENTNTPLPYIDVVNETLEYFVANNSLAGYTGHDTDDASSAELLASPQFVNDAAYDALKTERFPPPLPFHRPLETSRRYFDKFGVPLQEAMEALRPNDAIDRANATSYGWRDILMEELRLSRAEYEILSASTAVPLWRMYGFPNGTVDAGVITALSNAKAFARRLGVSYEDVIELLKTKFINPDRLITLADPTNGADPCSFDKLEFRHSNPVDNGNPPAAIVFVPNPGDDAGPPSTVDYVRLLRFIRLWKKLGWTIEQTDEAITALYPAAELPTGADDLDLQRLDTGFRTLLPRLGIASRVMDRLNLKPDKDLPSLLACWSQIDTHGTDSLYRQMFLGSTLLKQDPAFAAYGDGNFLQDNNQKLLAHHAETLRAAFNLTAEEFSLIFTALGFDADTTLTLDNISAVYRRGWLARKLRLSVREFLLLCRYTGLDPFAAPDPPNPPIMRLLKIVEALRAASLKPAQALYLIWNEDIGGNFAPDDRQVTDLARTLRAGFADIEGQFAVADDPNGDIARARMTLVYGGEATDFFFGLLNNTFSVDIQYGHPQASLEQSIVDAAGGGISYDHPRKRLSYNGVLSVATREALKAVAGVLTPETAATAFRAAVDELYKASQAATGPFFARYPELLPLYYAYVASAEPPEKKRAALLANFLPELKERRKRQQALAAVGAASRTDATFAQAILDDPSVLHATVSAQDRPTAGLVGHWKFDEGSGTTAIDASGNGNTGTLRNGPTWTTGKDGGGLGFDGVDDIVEVVASPDLLMTHRTTIAAWIYPTGPGGDQGGIIVNKESEYEVARWSDGTIRWAFNNGNPGWAWIDTESVAPLGRWTHVAVVFDEGNVGTYVDGALVHSFAGSGPISSGGNDLTIGARRQISQPFQGVIDEVRIYDTALSVAEVKALASSPETEPALADLTALETPGLSARFFLSNAGVANPEVFADAISTLAPAEASTNRSSVPSPPREALSGAWSGYLEAPENGLYAIAIETNPDANASLTIGGDPVELARDGNTWRSQAPIELTADTLCPVVLRVDGVTSVPALKWKTAGRGWEAVPARYLYAAALVEDLRSTYVRYLKASSLATGLKLTANEIAHFAVHADYRVGGRGWLNALSVSGTPDAATSQALHIALSALLDFSRLSAALAPDDERLLSVLRDPAATLPDGDSLLLALTRWDSESLNALLARCGKNQSDFAHLDTFRRVYDAYTLVTAFGISAPALIGATTNEPNADTVHALQSALRARYDEAGWLDVIRPINDTLRELQRDALVAYVLQKLKENPDTSHIDTPDKLFEYFLMDVETDPCMQTSRIRHALSSVQLFIERSLMNLEPRVSPSAIDRADRAQWEWMKRYRVWEANRKVFLWPENWLEPELRDDQSPFFKETMSQLLQSDITEDAAATALLDYLSKLEEVAKLEPCGIHYEEDKDVAHVVARTAGANRKYYYRRRERSGWTPWEQVKLEIEDNPVIPVVWKGRLFLFWLKIMKQPVIDPASQLPFPPLVAGNNRFVDLTLDNVKEGAGKAKENLKETVQAVLCWSEYYNGKWQPQKTSDVNSPMEFGQFRPNSFDRSSYVLNVFASSDALLVRIFGTNSFFAFYNTHSVPLLGSGNVSIDIGERRRFLVRPAPPLWSTFWIEYDDPTYDDTIVVIRQVLTPETPSRTVETQHQLQNAWDAPFFFEDTRHVFYTTTTETLPTIAENISYGVDRSPSTQTSLYIPPLVNQNAPRWEGVPGKRSLLVDGSTSGTADPSSTEWFVTEDANLSTVIGASATVRYGDLEIGSGGVLSDGRMQQG